MGYMLETRGLTKRFGRGDQAQDAVADVSLHIREGEVYGLLGPNGAGKSTTLKMICGMLRPTAGEILFAGHAWRREDLYAIGSLIEEAPLYPNLTARENLRVRTTLLGLPKSRIDEVLAAVDLADTGKKRAGRFSMGMRQRLGLALALIARPRLLVLDEPTSHLDIRYQIDLLRILRHLAKSRNVAVIMSIHELELAQKSADKVICVKDGRVFRAGAPEDIFTRETIGELYGLQHGTFNERFGSVEIGCPHGDAHTFVIAGAGTGSAVFRQLIRQGKAFYAGVLHEGDIDCELARDLATECVAERAFEPIGDKTIARAKELLVHCARLIVCPAAFGTINARNAELVEFARSHGIEVMRACEGASEDSNGYAKARPKKSSASPSDTISPQLRRCRRITLHPKLN